MKRLMQVALASFGVLALMLAGCNSTTSMDADGDRDGSTVDATGTMDVTVPTTDSDSTTK